MGDKISSEQTFSTKAGELKISCLTKPTSSLDFSIALAIKGFKAFVLITLLCETSSKGFSIFSSNLNSGKRLKNSFYFPLSLTSENKNKKQKDIIAESKGNKFEHSHRRMRVPFTLPPRQRRQRRA
jgi:hypothetical protein